MFSLASSRPRLAASSLRAAVAVALPGPGLDRNPWIGRFTTGARLASPESDGVAPVGNEPISTRWLSDVQAQLKQCLALKPTQQLAKELESVQRQIDDHWLHLLAGSEGYLTDEGSRGLSRHPVFWGDMDSMGHVNNVMYNRYAESGRVNWFANHAREDADAERQVQWRDLMSPRGIGLILRSIKTDYKFPLGFPDSITVLHKLTARPEPGADHIKLDAVILSDGRRRVAARCEEDIVVYDYRLASKAPLAPFMVEGFRETFDRQEEARTRSSDEVRKLIRKVADLKRALEGQ